ncbi:hypothetical protein PCASD_03874 [Puccinia coronata f. sp. avenae]|uniref:hAT-like transposase RNase-H fold domain-containing protein n=1 Tax=Puccinia coronata f. sp. avenae TaxID=200324 RepID=A0A2N5V2Q4_9BASI|nr:hypothetical protein PCASD_03874 [Puccinia coronata f. sp. avenae]
MAKELSSEPSATTPKFQLPSCNTLKTSIISMFNSMKEKLSKSLEDANSVALTTDLWTSTHQDPFMVVTAHYICSDWNLHKQVISFKPLPAPHTGIAIAEKLIKTMVDWKIIKKVSFITVENASSNDVALARVSSVLFVKDGLKITSLAVKRIRESVQYSKSTAGRKQLFQEAIVSSSTKSQALHLKDIPTRWNSTYLMIKSSLPYKYAFKHLAISSANYKFNPTPKEWEELTTICNFLLIFHTATLKLGGTHYATAHKKFNKYWSNRQHFSAIALAFDPRSTIENIKDKLYDWFASVSQSATNRLKPGKQKEVEDTNTSAEGADIEARFKRYLASKKTNSAQFALLSNPINFGQTNTDDSSDNNRIRVSLLIKRLCSQQFPK